MKRWKPTKGTRFWIISTSNGNLYATDVCWENDLVDKRLYDNFNCFQTRDAAEVAVKAVQETLKNIALGRSPEEKREDTECSVEKDTKAPCSKRILEIRDTVFNQTFRIYIGYNFLEYYKEVTGDDYVGDDNVIKGYSINTDRAEICLWIAYVDDIPTLVHELQHAMQYALYSRCDVKRNENELPAYYMEFLVRETLELLSTGKARNPAERATALKLNIIEEQAN